mmetsp:Transcript_8093/g.26914  ORF Transcript_8093/g.26914 Transcript_8093/m.26914 type:complete len:204 (-) Transcript_8093:72-683(-)
MKWRSLGLPQRTRTKSKASSGAEVRCWCAKQEPKAAAATTTAAPWNREVGMQQRMREVRRQAVLQASPTPQQASEATPSLARAPAQEHAEETLLLLLLLLGLRLTVREWMPPASSPPTFIHTTASNASSRRSSATTCSASPRPIEFHETVLGMPSPRALLSTSDGIDQRLSDASVTVGAPPPGGKSKAANLRRSLLCRVYSAP